MKNLYVIKHKDGPNYKSKLLNVPETVQYNDCRQLAHLMNKLHLVNRIHAHPVRKNISPDSTYIACAFLESSNCFGYLVAYKQSTFRKDKQLIILIGTI